MSDLRTLLPGQSTLFSTRIVGYPTIITAQAFPPEISNPVAFTWHRELCCQPVIEEGGLYKVSALVYGDGALVSVRNSLGTGTIQVLTDYWSV